MSELAMEHLDHINSLLEAHDRTLIAHVQRADSKAGVLATAVAGIFSFLLNQDEFRAALRAAYLSVDWWLSRAIVAALGVTFVLSFSVISPRKRRSSGKLVGLDEVALFPSPEALLAELERRGPEGIAFHRVADCHANARVCRTKFRCLRIAIGFAALATLLTAIGFLKFGE